MRGRIRGGSLRSSKLQIALVVSAGLRRRFVAAVEPKWKEHLVDIGIPVEACQEPPEALAQGYAQLNQAEGSDVCHLPRSGGGAGADAVFFGALSALDAAAASGVVATPKIDSAPPSPARAAAAAVPITLVVGPPSRHVSNVATSLQVSADRPAS